jgi:hypothetical protein
MAASQHLGADYSERLLARIAYGNGKLVPFTIGMPTYIFDNALSAVQKPPLPFGPLVSQ